MIELVEDEKERRERNAPNSKSWFNHKPYFLHSISWLARYRLSPFQFRDGALPRAKETRGKFTFAPFSNILEPTFFDLALFFSSPSCAEMFYSWENQKL